MKKIKLIKPKTEKNKKQIKNKKIWIWTILNLFLILFGASVIVNITYIPKYLALKHRSDNALKVNITAYDDTNNTKIKLFLFQYQTVMASVGDLMAQYPENYHLSNHGGLGHYLDGITYIDENNSEHNINEIKYKFSWIIYINNKESGVGIDSLYLHSNESIELYYMKNK